jgi:hypothetical protein
VGWDSYGGGKLSQCYWDYFRAQSMSRLFEGLTEFFPDEIGAPPVLGEIAFDDRRFKSNGNASPTG